MNYFNVNYSEETNQLIIEINNFLDYLGYNQLEQLTEIYYHISNVIDEYEKKHKIVIDFEYYYLKHLIDLLTIFTTSAFVPISYDKMPIELTIGFTTIKVNF